MPNLVDLIADHFPPVSGLNVPLQSDVTITFNELMDESRLEEDVFIEGPDTDQFVGPGLIELRDPNNVSQGDLDDFLQSPGYSGIVSVDYTFETIGGTQTKVTLNPTRPFAPSISYRVFIGETLATGHPAAAVQISGDLYTLIQVEGNRLRIKI
jgi:hypothetical protein